MVGGIKFSENTNNTHNVIHDFHPGDYQEERVVVGSPVILAGIGGFNSGTDQFIQIHDSAVSLTGTQRPLDFIRVAQNENFSITYQDIGGLKLINGLYICNSSSGTSRVIGAQDCWFTAHYR